MKILITGGAGFIGSNLVHTLLKNPQITLVRVLDDLSTGYLRNIESYFENPRFEFIKGDIRDPDTCISACRGIEAISHQAALGSVPRSIDDPVTSHDVNVNGFINILEAARVNNVRLVMYASSSAVYGDLKDSPKVEFRVGKVLSPYAATKMTNELYAEAYATNYGMTIIGFRYFNVFGPKQDPDGPYAAVIPLFIKSALKGESPVINGDGKITRDFTPVENVVQMNSKCLFNEQIQGHEVFNVACGHATDLNTLWNIIHEITQCPVDAIYGPPRQGDIANSLADISKAISIIGYDPDRLLEDHLIRTVTYFKENASLLLH